MEPQSDAQASLEEELEQIAEERRQRRQTFGKLLLAALGVAGGVGLIALVPVRLRRAAGGLTAGDETIVSVTSVVAVDEAVRDRVARMEAADDQAGLNRLLQSGEAFMLDEGTSVVVNDTDFTSVHVRALDGRNAGREGWINFGSLINPR